MIDDKYIFGVCPICGNSKVRDIDDDDDCCPECGSENFDGYCYDCGYPNNQGCM